MVRNARVLVSSVAFLAVLSGCGGKNEFVGRPGLQYVNKGDLPPPSRKDLIQQQRSYVVGPYDKVEIEVYGMEELTRTVQVDPSGTIALPLIGKISAAGRSTSELADEIGKRLRGRYVRDPQVLVSADTVNQTVTVDGQVEKPGAYPVTGQMTLMRIIARAEGVTEYADTTYVIVYRQVDGKEMAALYDLRAIRQGIYADPDVYANDIVLVGESGGRRLFQSVIQGSALLTAPLIAILN